MRTCEICGKKYSNDKWPGHWTREYSDVCSSECFHIKFWELKAEEDKKNLDRVVISPDGGHYTLLETPLIEDRSWHFIGHSGRVFYVHFKDGRNIKCGNVWFQGTVPENFPIACNTNYFKTVPEDGVKYKKI
jgi:hypothetical protein